MNSLEANIVSNHVSTDALVSTERILRGFLWGHHICTTSGRLDLRGTGSLFLLLKCVDGRFERSLTSVLLTISKAAVHNSAARLFSWSATEIRHAASMRGNLKV